MSESFGMRRTGLDGIIKRLGGQALPDDAQAGTHVVALLDELADVIRYAPLEDAPAARLAEAAYNPTTDSYYIAYNPDYASDTTEGVDVAAWKTAAFLHELLHVSCGLKYRKPADTALRLCNYHIPAGNDDAIGAAIRDQNEVVDQNFVALSTVVNRDATLPLPVKKHLSDRINYGRAQPDVHYDTVLLDMLCYLLLVGLTKTDTYGLLTQLSSEAADRRTSETSKPVSRLELKRS